MDYHESIYGARDSRDIMDDYIRCMALEGMGSFFPKTMVVVVVPMVLPQTNHHNVILCILCQWFDTLPYWVL